jgi:hypothetical protein
MLRWYKNILPQILKQQLALQGNYHILFKNVPLTKKIHATRKQNFHGDIMTICPYKDNDIASTVKCSVSMNSKLEHTRGIMYCNK